MKNGKRYVTQIVWRTWTEKHRAKKVAAYNGVSQNAYHRNKVIEDYNKLPKEAK
jgi:hypothetical protein